MKFIERNSINTSSDNCAVESSIDWKWSAEQFILNAKNIQRMESITNDE